MKKYSKITLLVVIICTLLIISTSFCAEGQVTKNEDTVKIGFVAALSGSLANLGEEQVAGAKMAEMDINNAGGILGKPVELIIKDTKDFVDEHTAEIIDGLVLKDGVIFIAGSTADSTGWAIQERAIYRKVPF